MSLNVPKYQYAVPLTISMNELPHLLENPHDFIQDAVPQYLIHGELDFAAGLPYKFADIQPQPAIYIPGANNSIDYGKAFVLLETEHAPLQPDAPPDAMVREVYNHNITAVHVQFGNDLFNECSPWIHGNMQHMGLYDIHEEYENRLQSIQDCKRAIAQSHVQVASKIQYDNAITARHLAMLYGKERAAFATPGDVANQAFVSTLANTVTKLPITSALQLIPMIRHYQQTCDELTTMTLPENTAPFIIQRIQNAIQYGEERVRMNAPNELPVFQDRMKEVYQVAAMYLQSGIGIGHQNSIWSLEHRSAGITPKSLPSDIEHPIYTTKGEAEAACLIAVNSSPEGYDYYVLTRGSIKEDPDTKISRLNYQPQVSVCLMPRKNTWDAPHITPIATTGVIMDDNRFEGLMREFSTMHGMSMAELSSLPLMKVELIADFVTRNTSNINDGFKTMSMQKPELSAAMRLLCGEHATWESIFAAKNLWQSELKIHSNQNLQSDEPSQERIMKVLQETLTRVDADSPIAQDIKQVLDAYDRGDDWATEATELAGFNPEEFNNDEHDI